MFKLKNNAIAQMSAAITSAIIAASAILGCSPANIFNARPRIGPPVPIASPDAFVLHWFADGTLLLSQDNQLLIYDPSDQTSTVATTFPEGSTLNTLHCVTDDVAIAQYALPAETSVNYRINWRSPQTYEPIEIAGTFVHNYNLLDCERRRDKYDSALIKNKDGLVKHYGQTVSGIEAPIWTVNVFDSEFPPVAGQEPALEDNSEPDHQIELATYSSAAQEFNADYDRAKDQYLWYKDSNSFSAKPDNWGLSTWLVSSAVETATTKPLPAGPWVYEHGFWKTMSCFSCGCACYEYTSLQIENGQIYITVSGQAVDEEHRGIYKLFESEENSEWIPVATGEGISTGFSISPDGCSVAINKEQPYLVETCG